MKKVFIFTIITTLISGCAELPPLTSDHPATVTFQFKNDQNRSVLTFWRKMNFDGSKGSRFAVGIDQATGIMNMNYPKFEPFETTLDPGKYYLDSFQVPAHNRENVAYCLSEGGHYMLRNGWDDSNNKPLFMSFSVKENEKLTLPVIEFDSYCIASFSDTGKVLTIGKKLKTKGK